MKIAILGAAGVRTPLIVQAMALRQEKVGLTDLVLMDIDGERLELIAGLTVPQEAGGQLKFKISRTTDAREALQGADFVITTFRVGGMESRVVDERVALDLGVLGQETTGPGGFAMAMRTIPVLFEYIALMRSVCPNAWLINFANPAGMLAEAVLRGAGWQRAVGICDSPASMGRVAAAVIGAPPEDVYLDYFGLNHLGWIRSIRYQGVDVLPRLMEMARSAGGFPDLPFDMDFLTALGMVPNEYLYYYYHTRQSVQNILSRGKSRGEQITELNSRLFADLRVSRQGEDHEGMLVRYQAYLEERGQTYMTAETGRAAHSLAGVDPAIADAVASGGYAGVALDLIEALNGERPRQMPLNILNRGAIWGMDAEDVVEIPAFVGKGMIQSMAVGEIPQHCLALMKQVKEFERLTIAAAMECSYSRAVQALTIHPLVADYRLAKQLVDGYRLAHGELFPVLR